MYMYVQIDFDWAELATVKLVLYINSCQVKWHYKGCLKYIPQTLHNPLSFDAVWWVKGRVARSWIWQSALISNHLICIWSISIKGVACQQGMLTLLDSWFRPILCPQIKWSGAYCCWSFCPSVCLSVVNFNLCYNFWTVRDRDFIFGILWNNALSNNTDLEAKNSLLGSVAAGA